MSKSNKRKEKKSSKNDELIRVINNLRISMVDDLVTSTDYLGATLLSGIDTTKEEITKVQNSLNKNKDEIHSIDMTLCEMGQLMEKDLSIKCRLCDCLDTLTLLKTLETFESSDYTKTFTRKKLTANIINRCTEIMNYK